jgi:ATP phosphoribosyltransferase
MAAKKKIGPSGTPAAKKPTKLDAAGITIGVPKGRVLKQLAPLLASIGVTTDDVLADDRRLIRVDPATGLRFLLLKPDDVPTYVEYGAADIGVVGRDVLLEREYDLYTPVDLGIGKCRLVVAGFPDRPAPTRALRVATKFPRVAQRHYASRGVPVEIVYVQGSVELAPLTGLADVIVDLVESGETLRQNGLAPLEHIADVTSVMIANRASYKLRHARIAPLFAAIEAQTRRG